MVQGLINMEKIGIDTEKEYHEDPLLPGKKEEPKIIITIEEYMGLKEMKQQNTKLRKKVHYLESEVARYKKKMH